LLLSVEWCRVTNGLPGMLRLETLRRKHTVTLTWKASTSKVVGYDVYRSVTRGANYERLNSSPVRELTYTDSSVDGGVTYYYVVTAVDVGGNESPASATTSARVPGSAPVPAPDYTLAIVVGSALAAAAVVSAVILRRRKK